MGDKMLFSSIGTNGLRHSSGLIDEEFLPELRNDQCYKIYKEMSLNDPVIGSMLFAIEMLIKGIEWYVEPFSDKPRHVKQAELLETMMHDMTDSWADTISEIMTFLIYGFSMHEIVLKVRKGSKGKYQSKYNDGLVGIAKLAPRPQDTIERWVFNDTNEVSAIEQRDPNSYKLYSVPIDKLLLFRVNSKKSNPQSTSILRNCYRPWKLKKVIEDFEAIGVARDLSGLPVMYVPSEIMSTDATPEQKAMLDEFKKIVTSTYRNEQAGLVLPAIFDETGNRLFEFNLVNSGGSRQFDISEIVNRYNMQIVQSVLADFIMLGQTSAGSFALSSNKTKLFTVAIQSWLKSVKHELNSKLVQKIAALNIWDLTELPQITHGEIDSQDIGALGTYFADLAKAGLLTYDLKLENFLRSLADSPTTDKEGRPLGSSAKTDSGLSPTPTSTGKPTGGAKHS